MIDRDGRTLDHRLRTGPDSGRPGPDPHRRCPGHAAVHEPRAGAGTADPARWPDGHLLAGRDDLRAAHSASRVLGDDRLEVLRRIAQDEPTPPRKLDPTIPVDLETIVLKAMAKSPADRYATAAELAADLGRFLDNRPILARRPSLADRGAKWMRRNRALIVTATAGLLILVMGLAGAVLQYAAWLGRHNAALQAEVDRADRHAREAERHASEADRQRRLADRHSLAAQLRLAQRSIEARQFEVAQDLLDEIAPDPRSGDSGEFAWHYLRRLAPRTGPAARTRCNDPRHDHVARRAFGRHLPQRLCFDRALGPAVGTRASQNLRSGFHLLESLPHRRRQGARCKAFPRAAPWLCTIWESGTRPVVSSVPFEGRGDFPLDRYVEQRESRSTSWTANAWSRQSWSMSRG